METATIDADSIVANTWVREVVRLESTGSTNDAAKHLLEGNRHDIPLLIITSNQTSGRGQRGNVWWSDDGSLTFSIVFDGDGIKTPGLISFATAIAVCHAIGRENSALHPKVKWPNDVYLSGRKIAGILIESFVHRHRRWYVVGIGVNVNCNLSKAPETIQRSAISLNDALQRSLKIEPLLIDLLNQLRQNLNRVNDSPDELIDDYAANSIFDESMQLTVRMADGEYAIGQFKGFSRQGLLRLKSGLEIRETSSGHIESPLKTDERRSPTGNRSRLL